MSGIVSAELACAVNKNRNCKNREQRVLGPRLDPPSATSVVALLYLRLERFCQEMSHEVLAEASWDRWVIWVSPSTGAVASRFASNDDVRP
jgi:hypothetical protein